MLFVLAGVLGFITITALGFAFAGGDQTAARTTKRTQAIIGGGVNGAGIAPTALIRRTRSGLTSVQWVILNRGSATGKTCCARS